MARPVVSAFANQVYALLEPVAGGDEAAGWPLLLYVEACSRMIDPVDVIVRDAPGVPGWGVAMDANNAPLAQLPWLGQFAGVTVDTTQPDATQRAQILGHSGFARGTLAAMISAAQATMTGSKTVSYTERSGDAWTVAFTAAAGEVPSVTATLAAIVAVKPAGIIVTFNGAGGASANTSYTQVKARGSYATVKATYTNYLDLKTRGS